MSRSGLNDVEDDMDLSGFGVKRKASPAMPASASAPSAVPAVRAQRVPRTYRTGRSQTIAVKTTPDTEALFYSLADRLGLKVGETFERAVEALAREADRA
jgi:hypothetical protein